MTSSFLNSKQLKLAAIAVVVIGLVGVFMLMQPSEPASEVVVDTPEEATEETPEEGGSGVTITDPDPHDINCRSASLLAPEDGGQQINVWKLKDGECYPSDQFLPVSKPDLCIETHYHHELRSFGGKSRADTQPCGAAVESDIIDSRSIWITPHQIAEMENFMLGRTL